MRKSTITSWRLLLFWAVLLLGFVPSSAEGQSIEPQTLRRAGITAVLSSPENAAAGLTLKFINTLFITHNGNDTLIIQWRPEFRRAALRFGPNPGAGIPENYPNRLPDQGLGQLTITAFGRQPVGVYYCILQDLDDPTLTSMEFRIVVQPSVPVRLLEPLDKAALPSGIPLFRWEPIDGVPYYFLLLSRGDLQLETDPVTGDIVSLSGVNIIWQAFTPRNTLEYGASDPSGVWPPEHIVPLIPGERYHWLVFSAFGTDLTQVAWRLYPIRVPSFVIQPQTDLPQPQVLSPGPGETLSADEIEFRWRRVPGAVRYRVLLYESVDDPDLGNGTLLVWQHTTLDTSVRFYARAFLARERYQFQIVAETPAAISATSAVAFRYLPVSGFLRLRVVDGDDFSMVPYVQFDLERRGGAFLPLPFATDRFGMAELPLPEGEYRIRGNAPGYLPTESSFVIDPGDTLNLILQLERAAYVLHGRIQSADGQPVYFADVKFPTGLRAGAHVDGQGRLRVYSEAPLPAMRILAPGFAAATVSGIPYDERGIARIPDIRLQRAGARIAGRLTDGSGLPVRGVRFWLTNGVDSLSRMQPATGRYEFELEPGTWTLVPDYPGYYSEPTQYQITLTAGETRQASFVFYSGALVEGQVFASGEPVADALVELWNDRDEIVAVRRSDAFGRFRLDVRPGDYRLRVSRPPFAPQAFSLNLQRGKTARVDVLLTGLAVIRGRVTEAGSGRPLADVAIVDAATDQPLAQSDRSGEYRLTFSDTSTIQLDARLSGYVSDGPRRVTPVPGDSVRVDFVMQPAQAVISGTVTLRRSPVPGARVRLMELNRTAVTDSAGRFVFEVQPGSYRLSAEYQCFQSDPVQVEVGLGQTRDVELVLTGEAVTVTGQVSDWQGRPLPGASVLAMGQAQAVARTDSTGTYQLCLPPGPYLISATQIGYQDADTTVLITPGDSLLVLHFRLRDNFARILGRVQTRDGMPVAGVNILLTNFWQQLATTSDNDGRFVLDNIIPGRSTLTARSSTFFAPPLQISLGPREERQIILTVSRSDGYLAGKVINGYTGLSMDSAMVVAQLEGSSNFFSTFSGPDGRFRIEQVPNFEEARFTLLASKPGYVLRQTIKSVPVNSDSLELHLLGTDAVISGTVVSADRRDPVIGATITLQDASGNTTTTTSDSEGRFSFTGAVYTKVYRMWIQHPRFYSDTVTVTAPSLNGEYLLRRKLALVSGSVVNRRDGSGMEDVAIIFTNLDGQGRNDTTRTDSTGRFARALWPGEYQITAAAPLFFSDPPQLTVTLQPEDTLRSVRFELEKQVVGAFSIAGPTQVTRPGAPIRYRVEASDTAGRTVREVPNVLWWTDPGPDTLVVSPNGEVFILPGYSGSFTIGAMDSLSGLRDSLQVQVSTLIDSSSAVSLFARNGMRLHIQAGTVSRPVSIHLATAALSPVQNLEERFRVLPPMYQIIPQNVSFLRDAVLSLPVPEAAAGRTLRILRWDSNLSAWETDVLADAGGDPIVDSRIQTAVRRGGAYAVVALSKPLAVEYLELQPNPFSPQQLNELGLPGIVIRYSVTSDQAALPLVTAKIYNLQGNLITILANQKPVPKGPQYLIWDGRTLTGNLARNGRYLLRFTVEDGRYSRELLRSIVLVQ